MCAWVLSSSSRLTLCDPMDCSLTGTAVHGTFQATILEWVVISSRRGSSWTRDRTCISCIGRQILYHCAIWEVLLFIHMTAKCIICIYFIFATWLLLTQTLSEKMLFYHLCRQYYDLFFYDTFIRWIIFITVFTNQSTVVDNGNQCHDFKQKYSKPGDQVRVSLPDPLRVIMQNWPSKAAAALAIPGSKRIENLWACSWFQNHITLAVTL